MSEDAGRASAPFTIDRRVAQLRRRVVREASSAIAMLESAMDALLRLDEELARRVRREDDQIDTEEVAIEQDCYQIMALHSPYARDFRTLAFILKVNADIERVGDHASSIAKVTIRLRETLAGHPAVPAWPTALLELGQRVPMMCHELMRAVLSEDVEAARLLVASDKVIDQLDRRLFEEVIDWMNHGTNDRALHAAGLYLHRVGRELERVGDLMCNIAEDVVYLATGMIIRHEKRRLRGG